MSAYGQQRRKSKCTRKQSEWNYELWEVLIQTKRNRKNIRAHDPATVQVVYTVAAGSCAVRSCMHRRHQDVICRTAAKTAALDAPDNVHFPTRYIHGAYFPDSTGKKRCSNFIWTKCLTVSILISSERHAALWGRKRSRKIQNAPVWDVERNVP